MNDMLIFLTWRQDGAELQTRLLTRGTTLCVNNRHCVNLVNKCCIVDKRRLLFDGVERETSSPLSLASLATPMLQAHVCARQHTDAQNHHQDAETERQCHAVIVSVYYQQYSYISHFR